MATPEKLKGATAAHVRKALALRADSGRIETSKRFFKTDKGEYGEGDQFLGVSVPEQREVVREFRGLSLSEIRKLLRSKVHEERLTALLLMVDLYRRQKDEKAREAIVRAYLADLKWVNNWDLVDSSAPQILGDWLLTRDRSLLYRQIESKRLFTRRVAILATQAFIKNGESADAFSLAEKLLGDPEDLLHKAAGWMLREVGEKVGEKELRGFLKEHAAEMPRTMLRYSIEKFPVAERRKWMGK